jgi:hypothetical protein
MPSQFFKRLTLHNGVHGAALLAVSTVDALGHIDIITGRPAASVLTLLRLNGNSLGRADGLAELAGNAALLASGVTTQSVLTAESGGDGTLLEGVEDSVTKSKEASCQSIPAQSSLHDVSNMQLALSAVVGRETYGGRKNCSSTTYMPRKISAMRKYLLALSREDSES